MSTLAWIVLSGVLMCLIALIGSAALLLSQARLERIMLPLVAFSAGSLLGGAFFHMLPEAFAQMTDPLLASLCAVAGFTAFFLLEQFLHWHQCRVSERDRRKPLVYLILLGDGLHNFIGGLAIGGAFLVDVRLGITSWLAAAAHEIPQELGDFGILVHGGLSRRRALLFNFGSALTFLLGGLLAYAASFALDVRWLLPFAAGNFIYIAASDLIPEIHRQVGQAAGLLHVGAFLVGLAALLIARVLLPH
jgi:zinc and cadmium transporter